MASADPPGPVAAADLSEVLMAILDRLDSIEGTLAERTDPAATIGDQVQAGLSSFNARLGRLEEAFVTAMEDSSTRAASVLADIRRAVTDALPPAPAASGAAATAAPIVALIAEQGDKTRRLFERLEEARLGDTARLQGRLVALIEGRALVEERTAEAPAPAELGQFAERIDGLGEGISALRVLLDRHIEETENSISRRATEATRRLASDFGLTSRRPRRG